MILGITGISGSGKHTAASYLQKRGWMVLDADSMAHYLYRPYTNVWKAIVQEFGERILNQDDTINRTKLSKIVFNVDRPQESLEALQKLSGLVHPSIKRRLVDEIRYHSRKSLNIIIVAALWKELGIDQACEKMMVIKAQPNLAQKRIMKRDGIPAEVYSLRIKNQADPEKADWVVENNGTPDELYVKLNKILF